MKTKITVLMLFCFFNMTVFGQEKTKKELKAERELKKQKETISNLPENLDVVAKSQFDIDFENGISVEEFRDRALKYVRSLPWK